MGFYDGVLDLLSSTYNQTSSKKEKIFFKGDLNQMSKAKRMAETMGIKVEIDGGIPFVTSKEDYEKVTRRIVSLKVEGWWHYVSHE